MRFKGKELLLLEPQIETQSKSHHLVLEASSRALDGADLHAAKRQIDQSSQDLDFALRRYWALG